MGRGGFPKGSAEGRQNRIGDFQNNLDRIDLESLNPPLMDAGGFLFTEGVRGVRLQAVHEPAVG